MHKVFLLFFISLWPANLFSQNFANIDPAVFQDLTTASKNLTAVIQDSNHNAHDLVLTLDRITNSSIPSALNEIAAVRELIDSKLSLGFIVSAGVLGGISTVAMGTVAYLTVMKIRHEFHLWRHPEDNSPPVIVTQ